MKGKQDKQNDLRLKLRLSKLRDNDFSYQDIADLLGIAVQSIYNFNQGNYTLSYGK